MNKRVSFGLALTLLLLAATAQAQGDSAQKVEQLYAEGAALFKASKYRAAITKFEAAYKLYPDPTLLYNVGRSQEALGEVDAALATYKRCAASPKATAALKAKVATRTAILEKAKAVSKSAPADPRKPAPTQPPAPKPEDEGPGNGMAIAKWSLGGVGLATLVAGSVMLGLGASDHGKIDDAKASTPGDLTRVEALDLQDSGKTKKTVGYVLLGVGGAALVGSAVLFFLDRGGKERKSASGPTTRLTAGASSQGATLILTGTF